MGDIPASCTESVMTSGRGLMTGRDAGIREVRPDVAAAAGDEEERRQDYRDFDVVLQEEITGLLERWQRLSARYGDLGAGHERGGKTATATLLSMGAVVYDTCAQDLAGLLTGLDSGPGRRGVA